MSWAEVRLVKFGVSAQRSLKFVRLGYAFAQTGQQAVSGVAAEAGELGDLNGGEIGGYVPQKPTKLVR